MRRGIVSVLTAASVTFAVAGCAAPSDDAVVLEYAIWDQDQLLAMQQIAESFAEKNPGVTVDIEVLPAAQYWTVLQTALNGGAAADVFWMNGPSFSLYVHAGMLAPLDDQNIDAENYPEPLISLYSDHGVLYGAPKDFDTIALWYNKDLFDAAGVAYPEAGWTWEDLVDTAAALTDPIAGVYGIAAPPSGQEIYYNTIAQAGGEVISPDGETSGYGTPEALAGVKFWTDLIDAGYSPTLQQMVDTTPEALFLSGKVAMYQTGSWSAGGFADNAEMAQKINVAPLAEGPTGNQSVIHGLANVANAQSENLELAKKFAAFASSEEAAQIEASSSTVIPAYRGTQQMWVRSLPEFDAQVFIDAAKDAAPYPSSSTLLSWLSIETEQMSQIWAGTLEPKEGLQLLATQMQAVLDDDSLPPHESGP